MSERRSLLSCWSGSSGIFLYFYAESNARSMSCCGRLSHSRCVVCPATSPCKNGWMDQCLLSGVETLGVRGTLCSMGVPLPVLPPNFPTKKGRWWNLIRPLSGYFGHQLYFNFLIFLDNYVSLLAVGSFGSINCFNVDILSFSAPWLDVFCLKQHFLLKLNFYPHRIQHSFCSTAAYLEEFCLLSPQICSTCLLASGHRGLNLAQWPVLGTVPLIAN